MENVRRVNRDCLRVTRWRRGLIHSANEGGASQVHRELLCTGTGRMDWPSSLPGAMKTIPIRPFVHFCDSLSHMPLALLQPMTCVDMSNERTIQHLSALQHTILSFCLLACPLYPLLMTNNTKCHWQHFKEAIPISKEKTKEKWKQTDAENHLQVKGPMWSGLCQVFLLH